MCCRDKEVACNWSCWYFSRGKWILYLVNSIFSLSYYSENIFDTIMPTTNVAVGATIVHTRLVLSPFSSFSNSVVEHSAELEHKDKDLVFINYTFKRFEGLTQRGALRMTWAAYNNIAAFTSAKTLCRQRISVGLLVRLIFCLLVSL